MSKVNYLKFKNRKQRIQSSLAAEEKRSGIVKERTDSSLGTGIEGRNIFIGPLLKEGSSVALV